MIKNVPKNLCTGCKMCADLCRQGAISFPSDEQGFWYPSVDEQKCNNCSLCSKECPATHPTEKEGQHMPQVFAAWSKDRETRLSSTSGGLFRELAKEVLDQGGAVVGSEYTEDWKNARHTIAETHEKLNRLKGSKYFQSDTAGVYKAVQTCLNTQKKVLFCGTPCQNAALYRYLGREYESLYYVDFICRSINSPLAFSYYLSQLENAYGAKVSYVRLKDKRKGWKSLSTYVHFANGRELLRTRDDDPWVKGFIKEDLYTRPCCHECRYRVLPRDTADITIGDFWGIGDQREEELFQGISVILINSARGDALFQAIRDRLSIQERSLEEALRGNPSLRISPPENPKQEQFFDMLKDMPFESCVRLCAR